MPESPKAKTGLDLARIQSDWEKTFGNKIASLKSSEVIDKERVGIYADFIAGAHSKSPSNKSSSTSFFQIHAETEDGNTVEFIVAYPSNKILSADCLVTYETFPVTSLVEFMFDDDQHWRIAHVGLEAVESFRTMKFAEWEKSVLEPECEAALRRLLLAGPVCRLYDHVMFPTSETLTSKYTFRDEHSGKTFRVPHPVSKIRIWDHAKSCYTQLDPYLIGAPRSDEESKKYFGELLNRLRDTHGKEYIDGLLKGANVN